ncbi:MAG TPA: hypothetical protein VHV08_17795, partial [Pirellulales bacterium]|nr:hypothetical protein [Pirellulales bacterium]
PQLLQFEIGRRTSIIHHHGLVDSHNVFAHIWAGSGMICFAALMGVGWTLLTWRPRDGSKIGGNDDPLRDARKLLRMMIVLWVVRGFFTREILYNPAFNIALGLTIGFCLLAEKAREQNKLAAPKRPPLSRAALPAMGR